MGSYWATPDEVRKIERLTRALQSSNPDKHDGACDELQKLGAGAVKPLLTLLNRCGVRRKTALRFTALALAVTTLCSGAASSADSTFMIVVLGCLIFGLGLIKVVAFMLEYAYQPTEQTIMSAIETAVPTDDVRALVSMVQMNRGAAVDTASLRAQLSSAQTTGDIVLNSWRSAYMVTTLETAVRKWDVPLVVTLLEALSSFGTPSQIRSIRTACRSMDIPQVQAALETCVEGLTERAATPQPHKTLLRPSEAPVDHLLRPARDDADTDAGTLLRPNANPE